MGWLCAILIISNIILIFSCLKAGAKADKHDDEER